MRDGKGIQRPNGLHGKALRVPVRPCHDRAIIPTFRGATMSTPGVTATRSWGRYGYPVPTAGCISSSTFPPPPHPPPSL